MITAINEIARFESIFSKLAVTEFNATLPISIKVLKKMDLNKYVLQIGKKEVETKSLIPLKEGKSYWGDFKTSKGDVLQISNLLEKPSFENKKPFLKNEFFLGLDDIKNIFSKEKPKAAFKEHILHQMSSTSSKEEFVQYANMLFALENGVFFIPIEDEKRRYFFQFKNKQKKGRVKKEFTTQFYASFENLGPIKGEVKLIGEAKKLTLYAYFEKSVSFLKKEIKNLEMDGEVFCSKNIAPLFDSSDRLLDIKG
ncbi:MAG: hypothetical protein GXO31_04395 [Epsilonproteobacteria bacterium]|nr:hypothetical protein [Campylobacterota bacterium]